MARYTRCKCGNFEIGTILWRHDCGYIFCSACSKNCCPRCKRTLTAGFFSSNFIQVGTVEGLGRTASTGKSSGSSGSGLLFALLVFMALVGLGKSSGNSNQIANTSSSVTSPGNEKLPDACSWTHPETQELFMRPQGDSTDCAAFAKYVAAQYGYDTITITNP